MVELKPCPFCGGAAMENYWAYHAHVECENCGATGEEFFVKDYPEGIAETLARKSWNTRIKHERTCKNVAARDRWRTFVCSECKGRLDFVLLNGRSGRPAYCPNCGAKVVD